ncbi:adenosylcobalamin-dependent ribonucleoside-diphosphate reductase [Roseospira navarrensis]|uniref:Vitamin B12-dependent ribonucleotide reductase n=1 Tax=Roseospira navarrensis TaxID=140058 RepID=A0A7X1ZCH7_9PROT|nr:adenosylcobalamin-dependent ribonucleoside-diphosphate reductase [Roseospira navarrensis]MQX35817.1 adenosylcobalamin-dependent ribonucleoside-diphosphate reductase [Roseospira navarrensis]
MAPIAHQIWDMKYRLKTPAGEPVDKSVADTLDRVARALAAVEADPETWRQRFRAALEDFKVLPAGRILAGAGTDRKVTLFNCFVMGTVPDDMGGIFDHLREAALTMQQGGGIGYDFSTLRPKGAPVHGVGADASGPLSFMDVWDSMCRTIMSAGSRRGAMMATLRCDHPDIEAFIEAKREPGRLRMFNLSVLATDAFMAAVEADAAWDLVFDGVVHRTVRARDLWDRIMRSTYDYAEPGVIFIDRINRSNNLWYCEEIYATNPCGEQPLPPYGTCLLGSVNLARLVRDPFTAEARLDLDALADVTATAVRLLDNVIDVSRYPLPEQRREAETKRRIGLGITGLADALILCGARYGSDAAVALTHDWLGTLRRAAYAASIDLAREKGPFPLFDRDKYLEGETIQALDADLRAGIAEYGIRNALVTSVAPTGTISLFADNISSGLEPVFSFAYTRAVLQTDGSRREETVSDYAWRLFRVMKGEDAPLPDAFVDAQALSPRDHLVMQATVQRYIDSAVSKTINVPEDLPFAAFKDVYWQAWQSGCKGCTTYRPNPVTGAVLTVSAPSVSPEAPAPEGTPAPELPPEVAADPGDDLATTAGPGLTETRDPAARRSGEGRVVHLTRPLDRPEVLPGRTYKVRWPESDHAIYITVNDVVGPEGRRRPFEVFINSKNMEHYAWTVALTRMISAVFRRGGDVRFVVEELKAVFDPRGGQWMGGRYVPSLLAAIGGVIEQHMIETGFLGESEDIATDPWSVQAMEGDGGPVVEPTSRPAGMRFCPKCGQPTLIRQEGCDTCTSCGHSRCG